MRFTPEQLYFARRLFQLEVHKNNGQAYEDFFSKIMQIHEPEFKQVKPQGRLGDRKNDGFIPSQGVYYQVYSPEDASIREQETIDKLQTDFAGLYAYWNSISPIKKYFFTLNDKYRGAYASLYAELKQIENAYPSVKCDAFLSKSLEDVFMALPPENILDCLGYIPTAEDIQLDPTVLNEVITYLCRQDKVPSETLFPANPSFEEKISFNKLGTAPAKLLRYGSFQEGALAEYFKINSTFAKEDLRKIFNTLYLDAQATYESDETGAFTDVVKADLMFFHIYHNAYPIKNKEHQDAILVLMSYFFGYCDIFDEPVAKPMRTLFDDLTI